MNKIVAIWFLIVLSLSNNGYSIDTLQLEMQRGLSDALRRNFAVEQCCGSTIKICTQRIPACPLVTHLNPFIDWIVTKETDYNKLYEHLNKRYQTLTATEIFRFDTSVTSWAGDEKAPVELVAFFSTTCPHCRVLLPQLYRAVTDSILKGKVRLMAIPFGSNNGNAAALVANSHHKFWDFMNKIQDLEGRFEDTKIFEVFSSLGIPQQQAQKELSDPAINQRLMRYKKEGVESKVDVVPTFFINKHRYSSYKDPQWIIDATLFQYEQKKTAH